MVKEGGNTLSLKLYIDKHSKKVLFAEAEKDFVDFLFHIMMLPVGTVVRLLKNNGMVGCIGNLYGSIESISDVYMVSAANKEALLKPKSPSVGPSFPLLLPDSSPASKTYYICSSISSYCLSNVVDHPNTKCPSCSRNMTHRVILLEAKPSTIPSSGYVKEAVMYMVMDDLEVKPLSIAALNQFSVKDIGALEEKAIDVGINEALEMLKTSLYSKNVLTDVFLGNPSLIASNSKIWRSGQQGRRRSGQQGRKRRKL